MRAILIIVAVLLVPLVPFVLFGRHLEPTIESWFVQPQLQEHPLLTATAVVLLLASDILLPIPSSVIGTIAGQVLGTIAGSLATWIGLNLACLLGYWLAAKWGLPLVKRFADVKAVSDVETLTKRWGVWALIGLRPVPVLAEASVLFAGLGRMPHKLFWPAVIAANLGVAIAYSALGSYSAKHGWLGLALAISIAVPGALLFGWLLAQKKQRATTIDK